MLAFAVGCALSFSVFVYVTAGRYRHREPKHGETRADRSRRTLSSVLLHRVVLTTLAGGLLAVVLWHGFGDVADTVVGWFA